MTFVFKTASAAKAFHDKQARPGRIVTTRGVPDGFLVRVEVLL